MNEKKPTVFISCGQFTAEEKKLGEKIKGLVEQLTPYDAYFAETVTSLDSLTGKIFEMLNKTSGLITVMHYRGNVTTPDPDRLIIRGSLWIEQEIAIAAFLQQILKRQIEPIFFIQEGIELEGIRKYLHFNPVPFKEDKDILEQLKSRLPCWKLADPEWDYEGQTDIGNLVGALLSELKLNAAVARKREPWTTYSINSRASVASLEKFIGNEATERVSDLYLVLESKNALIRGVRRGCWGNQDYKKYYTDLIAPIESVISLIAERTGLNAKEKSKVEIRRVDLDYPSKSGLQGALEGEGYSVRWSRKDMDVGCEPVIQELDDGTRVMFKDESGTLTLLRKKGNNG